MKMTIIIHDKHDDESYSYQKAMIMTIIISNNSMIIIIIMLHKLSQ
jgi:hypothetical protein